MLDVLLNILIVIAEISTYIVLGLILDFIITVQQRAVYEHWVLWATLLTFIIVLGSTLIIQEVIVSKRQYLAVSYAFGCAIGTYLAMKFKGKK